MKNITNLCFILFLFNASLIGQISPYQKDWNAIEQDLRDGLNQSALEKINLLEENLEKELLSLDNQDEYLKALLFKAKIQSDMEEEGLEKAIKRFEIKMEMAKPPLKSLMQSMLAELYEQYLNHHLWKIQDRSRLADLKDQDLNTWDVNQFANKIFALYLASVKDSSSQKIKVNGFRHMIKDAYNAENIRSTLYDFLCQRALDYFCSEKYYINKPKNSFHLNDPAYFMEEAEFCTLKLETKDSFSTHFHALRIFQQILAYNKNDTATLVDFSLKRLLYIHDHSSLADKHQLYLNGLNALKVRFGRQSVGTEIDYHIANFHYSNSKENDHFIVADSICRDAIKIDSTSYGALLCKSIIQAIHKKSLNMNLEKVYPSDQENLVQIQYRNTPELHFKLYTFRSDQIDLFNRKYGEALNEYLKKMNPLESWSMQMKGINDFKSHVTEIVIPELKSGDYLLVCSPKNDLSYHGNILSYSFFKVSDIAYANRVINGRNELLLTHRKNGQALEKVKVDFFKQRFNSKSKKNEKVLVYTTFSDSNGLVRSPKYFDQNQYQDNNFVMEFSYQDDFLSLQNSIRNYKEREERKQEKTVLFTDRSIYRPGQVIYFKGINMSTLNHGKNPEINPYKTNKLTFYDVNRQKIDEIELTGNEYGSFSGSFTAPSSGLMGTMFISANNQNKYIQVEAYKRPKFELNIDPVNTIYQLNDTISLTGSATAFAGYGIDKAKIQYRVYRSTSFPYWNWRWGIYGRSYNTSSQEIKFGESYTDEKGNFSIAFEAIPDESIPVEKSPEFNYVVEVDVTDSNGETHTKSRTIKCAYHSLNISIIHSEILFKEEENQIKLESYNLNGQSVALRGTIKIEKLKRPDQFFVERYWTQPDVYHLSKGDYHQRFPGFPYEHEADRNYWETEKLVLSKTFDSALRDSLDLTDIKNWEIGNYKITFRYQDRNKQFYTKESYCRIEQKKEPKYVGNDLIAIMNPDFKAEAGDTFDLFVATFLDNVWILYELEHDQKIIERKWILSEGIEKIRIPILEEYRGNVHLHLSTVKNNRFIHLNRTIIVPWTNKELKIEYASLRDKLYPGESEQWTIKISGMKGEKVGAELVASLYDASLDQFKVNTFEFNPHQISLSRLKWNFQHNFSRKYSSQHAQQWNVTFYKPYRNYRKLNWFGFNMIDNFYRNPSLTNMHGADAEVEEEAMGEPMEAPQAMKKSFNDELSNFPDSISKDKDRPDEVQIRTNLNETVFFYPHLNCDTSGNIVIAFTMNEALSKWKLLLLAHTKDLKVGKSVNYLITQKELMVVPNPPRFFREGDQLNFTAKVSNLTDSIITGNAQLKLFNALNMEPIDELFKNQIDKIEFSTMSKQSSSLNWGISIPKDFKIPVAYRVIASAGSFSDAEQASIPVLTNEILVTETMPMTLMAKEQKVFEFKRMRELEESNTLRSHKLSFEFTQNPAWYAIQTIPYLMEYPYDCTEQIFSKFYANSLSANLMNRYPRIRTVFDQWKSLDTQALKSKLDQNVSLKNALLEETPWVMNAQEESLQKKNIALLFDLNKLAQEQRTTLNKLIERQDDQGAFSWMPGGYPNQFITQYIVQGLGHLEKLGIRQIRSDKKLLTLIKKAIKYLDQSLLQSYENLKDLAQKSGNSASYLQKEHLSHLTIHYFYARSFFMDIPFESNKSSEAINYYKNQIKRYWLNRSNYMKGLMALSFHRMFPEELFSKKIVASLKENAIRHKELGMYWKERSGYFWYEMPIETQALMIELFQEVAEDAEVVEQLKIHLLKNKQSNHWKTTKATAAAAYALLMNGDNWLEEDKALELKIGNQKLDPKLLKTEAGTGYFKVEWKGNEIDPSMNKIQAKNPNDVMSWGGLYWQYFEDLDKVTAFVETPLKIEKQLYVQKYTDKGPLLINIEKEKLQRGDLIKVVLKIKVDRDMEYIHMKDMRASCLEPENIYSQFKYQDGLGYYEQTGDRATHFFFSNLPKGAYVFEYPLRVTHKGDFSNGVTSIQSMYAPEFTAHSKGIRIKVD